MKKPRASHYDSNRLSLANENNGRRRNISRGAMHRWCCNKCGKLLGVATSEVVEIRDRDRVSVIASLPVARPCPKCHRVNWIERDPAA